MAGAQRIRASLIAFDNLVREASLARVKRSTLYGIAAVLAIAALFFFMTTARAKVECKVCMDYRGRYNCATAVGSNEKEAHEGAQSTACGPIAAGMDQQIECGRIPPAVAECRPR